MPIQKVTAISGVAKQASKGTLAANPTFAHGVSGGQQINVEPTQSPLEVTSGKRAATNIIRESVASGGSVESPAYLKSLGLYLLGALGSVTSTGSGPYTHTYATGDLPHLSLFSKGIDTTIQAIRDCKIDELTLSWEGAKPVELSVTMMGTVFSYPATFNAGTDESGSESFLVPVGGSFQVDVIGSTPVAARVTQGSLTIKNNLSTIDPSASIESDDVFEGMQEHEISLTIVPDDLAEFRKVITGSANGSAVSSTVPLGSVSLTFKENNGAGGLTVTGSKVAFMTAFPEADPAGGAVELELSGIAVIPTGGTSPLTYALTNTQASY